jgi:hypothetical protein
VPTILAFLVTFFAIEKSNSQSERQRCETAFELSFKNDSKGPQWELCCHISANPPHPQQLQISN